VAGPLYGRRYRPLGAGARTCLAPRFDFSAVAHEHAQLAYVLVVDFVGVSNTTALVADTADLAAASVLTEARAVLGLGARRTFFNGHESPDSIGCTVDSTG